MRNQDDERQRTAPWPDTSRGGEERGHDRTSEQREGNRSRAHLQSPPFPDGGGRGQRGGDDPSAQDRYGYTEDEGRTVYGRAPHPRGFGPAGYGPRASEQDYRPAWDVRSQGTGFAQRYGSGSGNRGYGNTHRGASQEAGGHRGRGPKGYVRSDDRIIEDLNEQLTEDWDLDASSIDVSVSQGVVTLEGTVEERWMKHRAEDIADRCGGVIDVVNRIRVQGAQPRGYSGSPGGNADA